MIELVQIEYMGYTASSNEKVSFVIELNFAPSRFEHLTFKHLKLYASVPADPRKNLSYFLFSIKENEQGHLHQVREHEGFTEEEHTYIQEWLAEQKVRELAMELVRKHTEYTLHLEDLHEHWDLMMGNHAEISLMTLMEQSVTIDQNTKIQEKKIRQEIEETRQNIKALEHIVMTKN